MRSSVRERTEPPAVSPSIEKGNEQFMDISNLVYFVEVHVEVLFNVFCFLSEIRRSSVDSER